MSDWMIGVSNGIGDVSMLGPGLRNCRSRISISSTLGIILLVILPSLLFFPILYYSLNTPFGLTDDYFNFSIITKFDDLLSFWRRLMDNGFILPNFSDPPERWRIIFEIDKALSWKLLGASSGLHRLLQWIIHFGGVFCFVAAARCILWHREQEISPTRSDKDSHLLPIVFLVYIWIFFPNTPASRIGLLELWTVFFLGLCNWMMALILTRKDKEKRTSRILPQFVLYLGYLGLLWSKEINVAPALWMLLFYCAFLTSGAISKKIAAVPMILAFFHALVMVYLTATVWGTGYKGVLEPHSFSDNTTEVLEGLFQIDTSLLITCGFSILSLTLLFILIVRVVKRRLDSQILFILFLFGQFSALFFIISLSYGVVLRYWYPLVPVFTTLLAFSVKFILEWSKSRSTILANAVKMGSAGFICFFVVANYYNFLFQTIIQHSLRNTDSHLISEITRLVDQGEYVQVDYFGREAEDQLFHGVGPFLKYFYGRDYKVYINEPEAGRLYYFVTRRTLPILRDDPMTIPNRHDYLILSYASRMAEYLQGKPPVARSDAGVARIGAGLGYQWKIYSRISGEPEILIPSKSDDLLMIRSGFEVYFNRNANRLLYFKEPCRKEDSHIWIALHISPAEMDVYPAETEIGNFFFDHRRRHGFDSLEMDFRDYGMLEEGKCAIMRKLPNYDFDIARIFTNIYPK